MSLSPDEENALRFRIRQLVASYPEPTVFGDCDCTSYSYFFMSIVLLTLGTCITVSALGLGATEHYLFSNLGHMWLVGPISISCGTMVGIKSFLYLRRKNVIKMLIRHRTLLRGLEELTQESRYTIRQARCNYLQPRCSHLTASTMTLPPAYDLIVPQILVEPPPPSYAEALHQMEQEKALQSTTSQENRETESDKETV